MEDDQVNTMGKGVWSYQNTREGEVVEFVTGYYPYNSKRPLTVDLNRRPLKRRSTRFKERNSGERTGSEPATTQSQTKPQPIRELLPAEAQARDRTGEVKPQDNTRPQTPKRMEYAEANPEQGTPLQRTTAKLTVKAARNSENPKATLPT